MFILYIIQQQRKLLRLENNVAVDPSLISVFIFSLKVCYYSVVLSLIKIELQVIFNVFLYCGLVDEYRYYAKYYIQNSFFRNYFYRKGLTGLACPKGTISIILKR